MQSAKIGKYTVFFDNSEEYHRIKREVWGANNYYVELEKEDPVIIDAGGHIGLTTLYFKKLFPEAKIIAFEPHPQSAELFRKNMYENQIEGVELVEKALAENTGRKEFYFDSTEEKWYSTAGFTQGAWNGEQVSSSMKIETVSLGEVLEEYQPDLVKLDIEGAEEKTIFAAREQLKLCPHYLIEFHPIEGIGMDRIVKSFQDRGFSVTVTKDGRILPWTKAIGLSLIEAKI